MKKVLIIIAVIWSASTQAVNYRECTSKISEVMAGPIYDSMIKFENQSCGNNGWVCVHPQSDTEKTTSDRVFSIALAAKATKAEVFVRWRIDANACNGSFPLVHDFRIK